MNTVAFHTLGCKVNQYETEAMEELFQDSGYKIVKSEEVSDVYVINTCTVTNLSDRKSRQFIRKAKRVNEDSIIAVVGCYSQVSPGEVAGIEGVDVIIGTSERNKIVKLCEQAKENNEKINIVRSIKNDQEFQKIDVNDIKSKTRAYLKIQDGCNQYCTYCIIPYARGPIRSRHLEDIIIETEKLALAGFKEIILTGIHVASYGKDMDNINLENVLKSIGEIPGIERIRLSSLEPNLINQDFMSTLMGIGKICDHFHLSLQSGSNAILKKMNRKYTREEYKEKIDIIRKYMPNAGITTDIIVGFPGETEEDFQDTLDFVNEIKFSKIHVFKYSKREGTPAATYSNQIDGLIKNKRSEILIQLGDRLTKEFNNSFINSDVSVLYEELSKVDERAFEGYTTNYIRVRGRSSTLQNPIGNLYNTKIIDANEEFLLGSIEF